METDRPEKQTLERATAVKPSILNALELLHDIATPPQIGISVEIVSIDGRSLRTIAPIIVLVSDSIARTVSVNEAGTIRWK